VTARFAAWLVGRHLRLVLMFFIAANLTFFLQHVLGRVRVIHTLVVARWFTPENPPHKSSM